MNHIKFVNKNDIKTVAILHKNIFPDHFLGMLSVNLITRFYESFVSDRLIFLVSINEDKVSGFVLGGNSSVINECKKKFVKDNFVRLFVYLVLSPKVYPLIFSRLKNMLKINKKSKGQVSTASIRLLSIGVNSEYKRGGIGSTLIKHFEEIAKQKGIESYGLSVYKTNEKAISFYKKNGLKIEKETSNSLYFYKTLTE